MKIRKSLVFGVLAWFLIGSAVMAGQHNGTPPQLSKAYSQGQFNVLLQGGFQYWENGYLVAWGMYRSIEGSPSKAAVYVYNKDGQIVREAVVWLDGAASLDVSHAVVGPSGRLVVSGGVQSPSGAITTYIAEIGKDDHISRAIRVAPYSAWRLCAAEDGTVWTYGMDRDNRLAGIPNSLRIRQFSFEKGQLRAMLDISTLNPVGWELPLGYGGDDFSFRCNAKTVVLYNSNSGDLVEVEAKTGIMKITKVAELPSLDNKEFYINGFALTESGEMFASYVDRRQKPVTSGLFHLVRDRSNSTAKWVAVEGTVGRYVTGSNDALIQRLLGADGDDLVYTKHVMDGKLYWSKHN
jgi:hypothetical protein